MDSDSEKRWRSSVFVIYLVGFLFTLNGALPAYINSTFLSHFTTERLVGILYTVSSLVAVTAFLLVPKAIRRLGNYRVAAFMVAAEFFSLLGMAFSGNALFTAFFFMIVFVSSAIIGFNLDVFLENLSKDTVTGKIRGVYLATSNIAWIVSPILAGFILTDGDYWKVLAASAILLLPVFFLLNGNFKKFKDPDYRAVPVKSTILEIAGDKNIRSVFTVSFLLQFFYSWMIIYAPIYLYAYLGFSWREIGVIFSIMLLPFVLTEMPLGRLADSRWGEKEVMSIGFIVMAIPTVMMSFIQTKNILLWIAILFVSRVGAAMVEVMSETYFFKKIDSSRANVIGMFRTMRPWAYVISPLLATTLFAFGLPLKYVFIALAVIMFFGLHSSLTLEDTR